MVKSKTTWVTITTFTNRPEAELAKGRLEQSGILANVRSDDTGGLGPYLAATAGVALQVEEKDLETARKILAA
ncbi:MAG: DUF2007 domain-containing protein [Deltaproteobacteria bacterium]|nr:DUF2007 domain-containing protein [Deltaproteobacteria bacterium]